MYIYKHTYKFDECLTCIIDDM